MKMLWFCLLLGMATAQNITTKKIGNIIGNPCTDKNHLFLAPGVLTAGSMNRACVSRFYTEGPAHLMLSLLTEDRQTIFASRELGAGDGGCLDINAPLLPNSKADLLVTVRYPEAQCVWERRVPLRISSGRVVVLSTERARYKPGELVRMRVLALRQDLAPSHGVIEEIWLEGPRGAWEGSRVTQWQRVRTRLGLAQLQYQLDDLVPSGKWTLRARLGDGSQGSSVFWVGNYELPPFQLSVRHAPKVLRTSERLVWTVCVRYPWSEAVEGMLVIRLRGAGGGSGGIRTAVQLRAPKACHRHAAAAKRVGLDGTDPPDVVVADFSFQEEGTRIWQNTTVVSQVVDKAITLEFLTKHRAVIAPGLPYKLKVKATRWDDKPAPNEMVRVCRYPTHLGDTTQTKDGNTMCAEGTTDASGVARLLFAAGDDAAPLYKFEAQLSNDTTISAVPLTLPVRHSSSVHAALGPLKAESRQARTFVPLYLHTNSTSKPYTVHFVVITRGGIIYRWGATTQCPTSTSTDQVHTAPRNSKCNNLRVVMAQRQPSKRTVRQITNNTDSGNASSASGQHDVLMAQRVTSNVSVDVSDALLERHLLRVMLPIKVSHQMCPDSHLIAYFYHEGELVSASKHFEMEECFGNKVEATWLTRQAQPGSTVSLHISTPGPALCGLSVLDTAAKWAQPPHSPKEQLMSGLRRLIDSHRNLTEYDAAGVCFLNNDSPEIPSSSIELTASWMAAAGVRLIGGDPHVGKHCTPHAPALLVVEETNVPRSDFSEAWLWRLIGVGSNGTAVASARAPDSITRFDAAAVCVSRSGVAMSSPAVLQVFREFFIHADSPRRLRRGDSTIIRYRIFNYLYQPLSVQIQILTDPHVEGPKDLVESACVQARASIARRFEVKARVAAPARVSIRAKAVSDGNCGNITSGNTGVSDEVIIRITVDPEGIPIREQKSTLLCGNNSKELGNSEVLWDWPPVKTVPGTETLTVWAVGDVTGPLLADADSLLLLPRGCGEQNMAQLATNLLALHQLEPTSIAALSAKEYVARGFTRQLQYVHPSGGFSAFGPSDATSSTWLTAFVIKHMRKAHKLLWPNLQVPPAIIRAERWLLNQQMENGCFRSEGQVFHRELRGGLNDDGEIASVALTAYVITSLIESSSPFPLRVIRNTLSCLRAFPPLKTNPPSLKTRVYALSLLAYAYVKLERYEEEIKAANEASLRRSAGKLEEDEKDKQVLGLLKLAQRNGDYVWWEASSLSTSIEATSYALLALLSVHGTVEGAAGAAAGAARWLNAHRSSTGGFISTQDTLVALEALTAWSSRAPHTHLNVTAQCSNMKHKVTLNPGHNMPDIMKLKPGERLSVAVEGSGCALIQATRAYNVLSPDSTPRDKHLSVHVSVHTDGPFDCENNGTSCFCAAVIEACVVWTGNFPEMALLEVTLPGGFGADAQLLYSQLHKPSTLLRRIELTPSSSRATFYLGTRDGSDIIGNVGHQCYNIHATGPKVKTRPAYVRVQDYYVPSVNDTQIYTIPEECLARIVHQSKDYRSSDNLFSKARSADSDDIVITHEFSFEDIPEGIPLEDPLIYDHLTENENYRIASDGHEDIGSLEKPKRPKVEDQTEHVNSSFDVPPDNVVAPEAIGPNQIIFHNADSGYFSESDAPVSIENTVSKGMEKDGSTMVSDGYVTVHGTLDRSHIDGVVPHGEGVISNNNFDGSMIENVNSPFEQSNPDLPSVFLKEDTEGNRSTSNAYENSKDNAHWADNVFATTNEEIDQSILAKGVPGTVVENDSKFEDIPDTKGHSVSAEISRINTNAYQGLANRISNEDLKTLMNPSSIHEQANINSIFTEKAKLNYDDLKNNHDYNNIAIESPIGIDDKDVNLHHSPIFDDEFTEHIKQAAKHNKDEVHFATRNNIMHEIDSLNTVAHKLLNATQRQGVHHVDYKQLYSPDDDDKVLNINNNQNAIYSIDNYNYFSELPKSKENDFKRSSNENSLIKPPAEKIIAKPGPDLTPVNKKGVENPILSDFHIIDTEKDLEVPTGIEGPIPAAVLPPPNFVPPSNDDLKRKVEFKHSPFEGALQHMEPPPPKHIPPSTINVSRRQRIPPKLNTFRNERPMYDGLPPVNIAPPNHHLRGMPVSYPAFPVNVERRIDIVQPPHIVPTGDLRNFQSIITPNGPYFYFKSENHALNKRYFIPSR
nr:pregnancy zone protein [Helicoverpa armigera]